jgi:hypothetical protein
VQTPGRRRRPRERSLCDKEGNELGELRDEDDHRAGPRDPADQRVRLQLEPVEEEPRRVLAALGS